jgi:nucleotide-binding universal stress UspA family protein
MTRFKNILFVVDRNNWHRGHYECALALAAREKARLTVMDVVDETGRLPRRQLDDSAKTENAVLRNRRIRLKELIAINNKGVRVAVKVKYGNPFKEIMQQVQRGRHDLVMLAPEVKGHSNQTSTRRATMQLLRKCPCPVWIMNSRQAKPARIMAAVDPDAFDPIRNALNTRILEIAASLAANEEGELHIANAWTTPGEALLRGRFGLAPEDISKYVGKVLNDQAKQVDALLKSSNVNTLKHRIHLVKGVAGKLLPQLARRNGIQLLVMGTLGRSGIAGWFVGNTAEKIIHQVNCSVLVIKPDRLVLPVKSRQKPARSGQRKRRTPAARVLHS